MVAEALVEAVTAFVFLAIPVLAILSIVVRGRGRRREETQIRLWCDAKGYAISRMYPVNTSILATMLFWLLFGVLGWLLWWVGYRQGWRLAVYDSEGGERTLVVRVRRGQIEETWG